MPFHSQRNLAQISIFGVIAPLGAEPQAEGVGLEKASKTRNQLEEQLHTAATFCRGLRIDVRTEIVEGDPEKEILNVDMDLTRESTACRASRCLRTTGDAVPIPF